MFHEDSQNSDVYPCTTIGDEHGRCCWEGEDQPWFAVNVIGYMYTIALVLIAHLLIWAANDRHKPTRDSTAPPLYSLAGVRSMLVFYLLVIMSGSLPGLLTYWAFRKGSPIYENPELACQQLDSLIPGAPPVVPMASATLIVAAVLYRLRLRNTREDSLAEYLISQDLVTPSDDVLLVSSSSGQVAWGWVYETCRDRAGGLTAGTSTPLLTAPGLTSPSDVEAQNKAVITTVDYQSPAKAVKSMAWTIENACRELERAELPHPDMWPSLHAIAADTATLPVPDSAMDVILTRSFSSLREQLAKSDRLAAVKRRYHPDLQASGKRHVPAATRMLQELYRVLRPGGRFIALSRSGSDEKYLRRLAGMRHQQWTPKDVRLHEKSLRLKHSLLPIKVLVLTKPASATPAQSSANIPRPIVDLTISPEHIQVAARSAEQEVPGAALDAALQAAGTARPAAGSATRYLHSALRAALYTALVALWLGFTIALGVEYEKFDFPVAQKYESGRFGGMFVSVASKLPLFAVVFMRTLRSFSRYEPDSGLPPTTASQLLREFGRSLVKMLIGSFVLVVVFHVPSLILATFVFPHVTWSRTTQHTVSILVNVAVIFVATKVALAAYAKWQNRDLEKIEQEEAENDVPTKQPEEGMAALEIQ